MAELKFSAPTGAGTMAELRPALDAALGRISGDWLSQTWDGDVLRLSATGLAGRVFLKSGQLVLKGTLGFPASMFRGVFESQVVTALDEVAASVKPADAGAE